MPDPTQIHKNKTPTRRHFIKEWADARNMTAADIIELTGIEKSQVYRWFAGQMPQPRFQVLLAEMFEIKPEALLRHPDQDWLAEFFQDRQAEERERIKQAMELAWPKRIDRAG